MLAAETKLAEKAYLRPQEAAEYTGIARTRLYRLLKTKRIPSALVGRTRHIRRADLDAFMCECMDASANEEA